MSDPGRKTRSSIQRQGAKRNAIGPRLKLARHHHTPPLTAEALSEIIEREQGLDITANTIAKIETGWRAAYDLEVIAFARALNVTADWLLGLRE